MLIFIQASPCNAKDEKEEMSKAGIDHHADTFSTLSNNYIGHNNGRILFPIYHLNDYNFLENFPMHVWLIVAFRVCSPVWSVTKHGGHLSLTSIYWIDIEVGIDFVEVCMSQKCSLLRQFRVDNNSDLLRKKWKDLMRTKILQLSNRQQVLLVDTGIFLDSVAYICGYLLILNSSCLERSGMFWWMCNDSLYDWKVRPYTVSNKTICMFGSFWLCIQYIFWFNGENSRNILTYNTMSQLYNKQRI